MASLRSNMKNISVIGAGLMGHALALVYVLGGHRVRIKDSKQEVLDDSKEMMAGALDLLVENQEVESGWNREKLFNSMHSTPIFDLHTHLFPPSHKGYFFG